MAPKPDAAVTAVIPNWNGARCLGRLLSDLRAQTEPPAEIVVVDNGSSDGSDLDAGQTGARVIQLGRNTGFAHAVNLGVEASRTPLVAILNADVELEPDFLALLAEACRQPGTWFATGKLLSRADPSRIDATFDAVSRAGCPWRCGQGRLDGPPWSAGREIAMAPLTAAVFHREVFRRVGPLDERFESYLEDVDLGIRCALEGLSGRYVPEAVGRHWGSATLGAYGSESVRLLARNQVFLVCKHYAGAWPAGRLWRAMVGQVLWGFVAARRGAAGAFLRGKWEGLRRAGEFGAPRAGVEEVLRSSEETIREWQRASGFDRYWRLYFLLTTGRA